MREETREAEGGAIAGMLLTCVVSLARLLGHRHLHGGHVLRTLSRLLNLRPLHGAVRVVASEAALAARPPRRWTYGGTNGHRGSARSPAEGSCRLRHSRAEPGSGGGIPAPVRSAPR